MSVFMKNGNFCIVQKDESEIPENYFYRGYFIVSNNPQTQKEFDRLTTLSKYSSNIHHNKCEYSNDIHIVCSELESNIFVKH